MFKYLLKLSIMSNRKILNILNILVHVCIFSLLCKETYSYSCTKKHACLRLRRDNRLNLYILLVLTESN